MALTVPTVSVLSWIERGAVIVPMTVVVERSWAVWGVEKTTGVGRSSWAGATVAKTLNFSKEMP
jgi:hypothetical protein